MPRGISGPYIVGARGGTYFAILPPEKHLLNAYRLLLDARQVALRNFPGGEGRARALAIDIVLREVQARVDIAAAETAAEADKAIVRKIKKTQVRPDPPAAKGGRRLQDGIQSRPLITSVSGGGVGIGDIDVLDQVADEQGRAYWRAQEFGSTHLVGKVVRGFFQPGRSEPQGGQFRTHPVFEVDPEGREMLITRPISERAFLREGAAAAEIFRQKALGRAVTPALAELRLIQSGNHPRIKAAKKYISGRGGRRP
jgi:hypothetical protein